MTDEQIEYEYAVLDEQLNRLCRKKIDVMYEGGDVQAIQDEIDLCIETMKALRDQYEVA